MLKNLLRRWLKPAEKTGTIAREDRVVAPNYHPLPVVLTQGEGVYLYDENGTRYLDMMSAYSAVSHGHGHPRILHRLQEQAQRLAMCSRAYHTDRLAPFAERLTKLAGLEMMLPMNTGAEAVETAIKAARRWGYQSRKIPADMAEIIVAEGNFHGRTTTIVGFSSDADYKKDFGPYTPGFKIAPYGDIAAIEAAITPNTAAILIEPIQGEAGIRVPPPGYLRELRRICTKHNILLVFDEIQSGLGRTGKMFCFQHEDATPDLLILGKALGGGVLPVSAVVGRKDVLKLFNPGSHGSTFGGNPLAAAVALEALDILEEESLVENSATLGAYMMGQLRRIQSRAITDIRGKGLWIGVEFDPAVVSARAVCEKMMARGILSKDTHGTVVRFAPPLTINKEEVDECLSHFREVLAEIDGRLN
jgi:ornithine--oxo-acid transaminase